MWLAFIGALLVQGVLWRLLHAGYWPHDEEATRDPRCTCHQGRKCMWCMRRDGQV
jgi:hypothetical protein